MGDNDLTDTFLDIFNDVTGSLSNLTADATDLINSLTDGTAELVDTFTETPQECIRNNPEPYNGGDSGIAGSVGWAVGLSFLVLFGTALIAVFIRMCCCKTKCALQKDASCTRKFCSWFGTLLLPMLLAMTTGLLVAYWPQDPQVNDCTKTFDLLGLITNFLAGDASAPMVVLVSIYNPNRVDITFKDATGTLDYEGVDFGAIAIPEFTAKSRHITDVEVEVLLTLPPASIVTRMAEDYFNDELVLTLRLDFSYEVAGFSGSETGYVERITTGYREDNDSNNYSLCKCKP